MPCPATGASVCIRTAALLAGQIMVMAAILAEHKLQPPVVVLDRHPGCQNTPLKACGWLGCSCCCQVIGAADGAAD